MGSKYLMWLLVKVSGFLLLEKHLVRFWNLKKENERNLCMYILDVSAK